MFDGVRKQHSLVINAKMQVCSLSAVVSSALNSQVIPSQLGGSIFYELSEYFTLQEHMAIATKVY
jgi:hypothetical protein